MADGIVFNIQNFSIHDGPGIRTVVFLKGCPLRCRWCANPESQRKEIEMGWTKGECIHCSECERKLTDINAAFDEQGVLNWDRYGKIDPERYEKVCPSKAFHVIGKRMTSEEVINEAIKDKAFFDTSGGGITLSGGEPLMQSNFALEILELAKAKGVHRAIETCGCVSWDVFDKAASLVSYLIMDIKCIDKDTHIKNTGGSNEQILKNLIMVRKKYPYLPIKVRTPVIPNVNDNEEELGKIATLLRDNAIEYELLKYHKLGLPKYESLGREYPMGDAELSEEKFVSLKKYVLQFTNLVFSNGEGI